MVGFKKEQDGFTLIELLVAMTILAIGLLSIAGMQVTAIRENSRANTLTAATTLAEGVMEEILAWPTTTPTLLVDGVNNWDFDPDTSGVQSITPEAIKGAGKYSATYSIITNYGAPNLDRVTVVVTGQDPGNANRTVTLIGFKRML